MNIKLTSKKILLGILFSGMAVNLLSLFNTQFLYVESIFSFITLMTIPGLLLMLILKIKQIDFCEGLLFCLSLSMAFIMFSGLALNWILPWLHITDKPISFTPLLVSFNFLLSILGIAAYKLNKKTSYKISFPKINPTRAFFYLLPLSFPVLSVMGAVSLNNGGTNLFAIITSVIIAASLPLLLLKRNKEYINHELTIYLISLSVILMISFRSWYLFGSDIQTEYLVFNLTNNLNHWSANNLPGDLYNLCLSITILPAIISKITNFSGLIIFKLLLPLIFSLVPVAIYKLARIYMSQTKSFLAALFFLSLSGYYNIFATHEKQAIGTLFFIVLMTVALGSRLSHKTKYILTVILGMAMIFSHYSTAFIAIILLSLLYPIMFIYRNILLKKINFFKRFTVSEPKTGLVVILLFWLVFFAWYTQPNENKTNYFVSYLKITVDSLQHSFSDRMKADRSSIFQQLNIFYKPQPQKILDETYQDLIQKQNGNRGDNFYRSPKDYKINYSPSVTNQPKINPELASVIKYFGETVKRLGLILMPFGLYFLISNTLRKKNPNLTFIGVVVISASLCVSSSIIPFVSIGYDIVRIYQQSLIFLSILAVMGIYFVIRKLNSKLKYIILSTFFTLHFLTFTTSTYELTGEMEPSIQFNNSGYDYDLNYTHTQEIEAITWLSQTIHDSNTYIDSSNYKKIRLVDPNMKIAYSDLMNPSDIEKDNYVFLGYINTKENRAIAWLRSMSVGYNTPTAFLNQNKDLVYSNGGSTVFK